jgi:hypothetical protein
LHSTPDGCGRESRQTGVNLLVEGLLISWLAEAFEQDRSAIIQHLAPAHTRSDWPSPTLARPIAPP